MDNKQIAHDIAIAMLPKYMEEVECSIYKFNNIGAASINSENICSGYKEIYDAVLDELSK